MLQSGNKNSSGVASVAASSSGTGIASNYSSYNMSAWTGNSGTGYDTGGYDMNSMYNSYAQMYEQYYSSQVVPMCHVCCCLPAFLLHIRRVVFTANYFMSHTHSLIVLWMM